MVKFPVCQRCGSELVSDPASDGTAVWVDETGGDVCQNDDGDNDVHIPQGIRAWVRETFQENNEQLLDFIEELYEAQGGSQ